MTEALISTQAKVLRTIFSPYFSPYKA